MTNGYTCRLTANGWIGTPPPSIAFAVDTSPWHELDELDTLALAHAVEAGTVAATPDLAAEMLEVQAEHYQALGEVHDLLLAFCAERGIPLATAGLPADHDVIYRDPTGALALSAATTKETTSMTYRPELGYDPADYNDEPVRDDGLVYTSNPAFSAANAQLAIDESSQRAGSAGGYTSHPDFKRGSSGATAPVLVRHGNGQAIIGKDGQPLWGGSLDADGEVNYLTQDIEFSVRHPSRDDLAHAALREIGLRP